MSTTKTKTAVLTAFPSLIAGEVLSEQQFYKVVKIKGNEAQLENDSKEMIVVNKDYIEKCLISAKQYRSEKTVNKTEAAAIFLAQSNLAITVSFNKQVKEADVVKEVMDAYASTTPKNFETALRKAIKSGLQGTERTMVGRHYGELNDLGRVNFIDMEETRDASKDHDTRMRLVDPRNINWFICRGVKYTVK